MAATAELVCEETVPPCDSDAAKRLCLRHLHGWRSLAAADVKAAAVDGVSGATKLSPPAVSGLSPGVVRLSTSEPLTDRARERLHQLASLGFGAPHLLSFANGRVEGWLDARPLSLTELSQPQLSRRVAASLRALHAVPVNEPRVPTLWRLISDWLTAAAEQQADAQSVVLRLRAHEATLRPAADAVASPTVFCHNSLSSDSLLLENTADGGTRLRLSNLEQAAYNPRGFDLASHFCDWAGSECDSTRYPSLIQQRAFLAAYACCSADPTAVPEDDMQTLLSETAVYTLVAHLYSAARSLAQVDDRFDHRACAGMRLAELDRRTSAAVDAEAWHLRELLAEARELGIPGHALPACGERPTLERLQAAVQLMRGMIASRLCSGL
jgi:ethanolamine kinase